MYAEHVTCTKYISCSPVKLCTVLIYLNGNPWQQRMKTAQVPSFGTEGLQHTDYRIWNDHGSEQWRDLNVLSFLPFVIHIFGKVKSLFYTTHLNIHDPSLAVLPCLFQRWPLIDSEVTALREILEEVGVISTWILRAPSLLLLFSAAPCSEDLMALPTWGQAQVHTYMHYYYRGCHHD